MTKGQKLFLCFLGFLIMLLVFLFTPTGVELRNELHYRLQTTDDATNYDTIKEVENTCRAMMASYKADFLTYIDYNGGTPEQQGWADAAKIRANTTAAKYNEYILKNIFVWKNNIPDDIEQELDYVQ